jgi:beta-1,4-mannooligosaccharide/beta-1,4-mannosyl-N-acetylglucosamine phosphorylase
MVRIIGEALPNIPWEDKPAGLNAPVWRYSGNPIIGRNAIPNANSVFNSAVVPFRDGFAGVFRCDSRSLSMDLYAGFSKDGLRWAIDPEPIRFEGDPDVTRREYRCDPRVCKIGDRYYITWCNGYHGPTIGLGYTTDFKTFHQLENAFLPYNRDGVLFPRKIGDRYAMLSRPSDTGHTPFGDIFYSESSDLTFWGKHRYVMGAVPGDVSAWQSGKIGTGPVPIETDRGWLMIYHGGIRTANGFVYRVGCALLDPDQPWKVLSRSRNYILGPETLYECVGDVPNVTFPCAALTDAATGRIAIYYGCADTVTSVAFTTVDELFDYMALYPLDVEA